MRSPLVREGIGAVMRVHTPSDAKDTLKNVKREPNFTIEEGRKILSVRPFRKCP